MTTERTSPILSLRDIRKSYGPTEVLHGIDMDVYAGEVVALLGENGAGKSTVSNVISGTVLPSSGEMTWQDTAYAPANPQGGDRLRHRHDSPGIDAASASVDRRKHLRWPLPDERRSRRSQRNGRTRPPRP